MVQGLVEEWCSLVSWQLWDRRQRTELLVMVSMGRAGLGTLVIALHSVRAACAKALSHYGWSTVNGGTWVDFEARALGICR